VGYSYSADDSINYVFSRVLGSVTYLAFRQDTIYLYSSGNTLTN
jgi:hypothetical protein